MSLRILPGKAPELDALRFLFSQFQPELLEPSPGLLKTWAWDGFRFAQGLFLRRWGEILSTLLLGTWNEIVFAPAMQMLHPATR